MQPPKTKGREYTHLLQVLGENRLNVNKCFIEIINNRIYIDGREVNGFELKDGFVIITGQHFTSREKTSEVRMLSRFIPGYVDNYIYFLEDGFYDISKQEIRHISGATSVETKFQVTFRVEAERVWLKLEKRHPVKFAIWDGLYTDEIIEISLERLSS